MMKMKWKNKKYFMNYIQILIEWGKFESSSEEEEDN